MKDKRAPRAAARDGPQAPAAAKAPAPANPAGAAAKRALVLHIGSNKTGSSAIQQFLRLNAELLESAGLVVAPGDLTPRGAVTGQHVPAIEALRRNTEGGEAEMGARLKALMAALPAGARLLISAENLSNPGGAHQLFAQAAKDYDVRVILYIRRQDDLLLSSWQQWSSKVTDDFWAWMLQSVGVRGDWRVVLMQWEQIVPRANITVRIYDRAKLAGGDVVADFAEVLGVALLMDKCRRGNGDTNPSYSEAVLDFVKGNPQLFKNEHDPGFYRAIEALTGDAFHRKPRESMLTLKQRQAILARYNPSNAWVRQNYFADSKTPLFHPPVAGDFVVPGKDEIEAQKWALVASLINGLAQKVME